MFADPVEHLAAELRRLDLLLHREILRLRAAYQLSLDEFRGLYVSDEQVDRLINQTLGQEGATPLVEAMTDRAESLRRVNAQRLAAHLPWSRLVTEFDLSPFEHDVLLLAVAPEMDLKYETLYAYLNNDVTRKWPTCDLALRLLSPTRSERMSLRGSLLPQAPLFANRLLQPIHPVPERPSWLAGGFSLAPVVSHFLLGRPGENAPLGPCVEQRIPAAEWEVVPVSADQRAELRQIVRLFQDARPDSPAPVLIFEGRYGAGSRQATEAVCRALGIPLLRVDLEGLRASPEPIQEIARGLVLHQRLLGVGLSLEHGEALCDREAHPLPEARRIIGLLAQGRGPVFLTCETGCAWRELVKGQRHLLFPFADPDYARRRTLWEGYLAQEGGTASGPDLETLANRFILTPGQVKDAVQAVVDHRRLQNGRSDRLPLDALMDAARAQSGHSLGRLALKVSTMHGWDALVLPPATLTRVKEVAAAIRSRHIVYSQWGFERRIAHGRGLSVLFAGASGTGKTMTAGVISTDLGLDLYKVELSGVVSKYIGETEKNLERIFRAAHCSNAILFFDEADALFGKRSEVKDAHDRYANIEVAYLLQRMEEHEGVTILASNLSKNIDEAFSRRLHYVVEFPLPDETQREQLWRGMFPAEVPLAPDVDFRFLAKQFAITGGDIRNVALEAAFLAAHDGQVVTMRQLIRAMARQMIKQGRVPSPVDFKQYHSLIGQEE
jgi:hypothetical protein